MPNRYLIPLFVAMISVTGAILTAQDSGGTDKSDRVPSQPRRQILNAAVQAHWANEDRHLWYRRENLEPITDTTTSEFVLVDTKSATRQVFSSEAALNHALGISVQEASANDPIKRLSNFEASPRRSTDTGEETSIRFVNETDAPLELVWIDAAARPTTYGKVEPKAAHDQHTFAGHLWMVKNSRGDVLGFVRGESDPVVAVFDASVPVMEARRAERRRRTDAWPSPDGKWVAEIEQGRVLLRSSDDATTSKPIELAVGSEAEPFEILDWSPDSASLVVAHVHPVEVKEVHRLESSPRGGGRAKLQSSSYLLPGEPMTSYDIEVIRLPKNEDTPERFKPFAEAFDFGRPRVRWIDDHRFLVEKIDRGHQRFRLFRVDTLGGEATTIIDEKSDTFVWTMHGPAITMTTYLDESREMIYASERSGWRHLYLVNLEADSGPTPPTTLTEGVQAEDGLTVEGSAAGIPITSGDWVVRSIERVDEVKRQIWFTASGMNADQDPYLLHHYRVNFDGTDLVTLTQGNGTHSLQYSPTGQFYIDSFSRVDAAPENELRRSSDGSLVRNLEVADTTRLTAGGWRAPEVFSAKGRDGVTDIWGFIARPRDFDASKKYPVIEYIYAGPHDSHVPKSFSPTDWYSALTELGFIVVRIDGMGTANRSKAFHDVCWHNLKDAGFPDRIAWMKAAAQTRPFMDLGHVGIYGTSAGGQNAVGALLFHGDFYRAAAAFCGCHDNRMDKASWNEQWMGYPVGEHYAESSNIDNAANLQGKLFLMVGELDTNVPPESTLRLADALIAAEKDFEMLVMPGVGHSDGGAYGQRRMRDFFQQHLQGIETPDRNADHSRNESTSPPDGVKSKPEKSATETETETELTNLDSPNRSRTLAQHFEADRGSLDRFYSVSFSPTRTNRLQSFFASWLVALTRLDVAGFTTTEQTSLAELKEKVTKGLRQLKHASKAYEQLCRDAPFAKRIIELAEARQRVDDLDPRRVAQTCDELAIEIAAANTELSIQLPPTETAERTQLELLRRSAVELESHLGSWYSFYDGYDPMFTWWVARPYQDAKGELAKFIQSLELARGEDLVASEAAEQDVDLDFDVNSVANQELPLPDFDEMLKYQPGVVASLIDRYEALRKAERQKRDASSRGVKPSPRESMLNQSTLERLESMDFASLARGDRVDWLLLRTELIDKVAKAKLPVSDSSSVALSQDPTALVGTPVGREVIELDLQAAMIAYSTDELIKIAEREASWCRQELIEAAREMGYGDDWKAAVEHVKTLHVEPGHQPAMIRELASESIEALREGGWISIPPIAVETYRMQMMSPERQLISPFFLGGESIIVSYPTSTMKHGDKLQSMRGNNRMFARATVHHEVIPGHHLQGFVTGRFHPHRGRFYTPFWGEGWAVYWEMLLYERGFARTPEERIGFLVWRSHRCARILFSLSFHLGRMTPEECVDLLVEHVGFDRNNAAAEVRRSIGSEYSPLYQAGYMLGALQLRELHREIVEGGKMTEREFHDAVLRENYMPIELLRASLTGIPLEKDFRATWKWYP